LALLDAFGYGYACWVDLSEAEIQALPWLMRLRNVVSVIWRMGRALATGGSAPLERIVDTQTSNRWIAMHEAEILDRLAYSLYHYQSR
jgi:Ser/Thr protein kinase RdoA (MazF antagonist)